MVTFVTSSAAQPIRGLEGLKRLDAEQAKALLSQIETQVAGKSGVLKLIHTTKDRDMAFERKSWYQAIARRQSKMDNTAQALTILYAQAGLSPMAQKQLEDYLQQHQNKVGGSSLGQLLHAHLNPTQNQALIGRLMPTEGNANPALRSDVFGSEAARRRGAIFAEPNLTDNDRLQAIQDRDQVNAQMCRDYPDINPQYVIGPNPPDRTRLVGISRSADATLGQQFDLNKPIVLFFGGSAGNVADYGYPAANAAGPRVSGGLNFLAVDYRGFGSSDNARPTPKTVTDDAMRVFEHVRSLGFTPDKIILRGYSMGAAAAARIHATCDLKGEKLMGVIYDRPMASASEVARQMRGRFAAWATQRSVGAFGADRYLELIHRLGSGDMSNAIVIRDSEDELGPPAEHMATTRGITLISNVEMKHEAHYVANDPVTDFVDALIARQGAEPTQ